jgi:hypothetical protein
MLQSVVSPRALLIREPGVEGRSPRDDAAPDSERWDPLQGDEVLDRVLGKAEVQSDRSRAVEQLGRGGLWPLED